MANPSGTRANRWNALVNDVSTDTGAPTPDADAWLNAVWAGMYADEQQGNPTAHAALRRRLEAAATGAPTLPEALKRMVV